MLETLVPKENVEIFHYLYAIEVALRELIIESLKGVAGPKWFLSRLHKDALDKFKNGIASERKTKWTQLVPHHPIYYVDFPDLRIIMERNDNWKDVFKGVFSRKEFLVSTLSELEFIRNKVAHNRKATDSDVDIVKGTYTKLSESIGEKKFKELVIRCTCADGIYKRLVELREEANRLFDLCKRFSTIEGLSVWKVVSPEWWFDEIYLLCDLDGIEGYFERLEEYCNLPQLRGSGHKIEKWVKKSNIDDLYSKAQFQFDNLLGNWRV